MLFESASVSLCCEIIVYISEINFVEVALEYRENKVVYQPLLYFTPCILTSNSITACITPVVQHISRIECMHAYSIEECQYLRECERERIICSHALHHVHGKSTYNNKSIKPIVPLVCLLSSDVECTRAQARKHLASSL